MTTNCTGRKKQLSVQEKADLFWNSDLEEIEGEFLPEGKSICDLPIAAVDERVPPQGCVLYCLGRVAYLRKDD